MKFDDYDVIMNYVNYINMLIHRVYYYQNMRIVQHEVRVEEKRMTRRVLKDNKRLSN